VSACPKPPHVLHLRQKKESAAPVPPPPKAPTNDGSESPITSDNQPDSNFEDTVLEFDALSESCRPQ